MMSALVLHRVRRCSDGDQCDWYWINIMLDTTLGVLAEYCFLLLYLSSLEHLLGPSGAEEFRGGGYYDLRQQSRFMVGRYLKQLALWLIVVTSMKLVMVCIMFFSAHDLHAIAGFVLQPFLGSSEIKLLMVMVATPLCMNALQFWVTDNFLGGKKEREDSRSVTPLTGGSLDCECLASDSGTSAGVAVVAAGAEIAAVMPRGSAP